MLSITDNHLYVIDADGHQQLFDVDKLKRALQEAFAASGNPNGYLSEDIACAVEAAMAESHRMERIFTQSEVDSAVSRILENAGCANTAAAFRRANSHLYIALDAVSADVTMLISRHLGVDSPVSDRLANQVVEALEKLNITSASPALYLELARYYEHTSVEQNEAEPLSGKAAAGSRMLLPAREIAALMPPEGKYLLEHRILQIANIRCLYPNCRLSLDLTALADFLKLHSPVTELEMAPALYKAGEIAGTWLDRVIKQLENPQLPLYLVLKDLDIFATRYLGTEYPAGRLAALEIASFFRNALGYPVKKVRCRTAN
jgi:hypothetical protein